MTKRSDQHLIQTCIVALLAAVASAVVAQSIAESASQCVRRGTIEYRPSQSETAVPEQFHLPAESLEFQERPLDAVSKKSTVSLVTFPSPVVTVQEKNNTVHCEYYRPQAEGKRPGVVVLHILGGSFELSRICCRMLAREGIGALFVKMPYYGPRRQADSNLRMISPDPHQTVRGMTQAVLDVRRAATWLASQEEIDPDRLGVTGISLGGIVSALAFSAEPRFRRGCFVLAGGNLATAIWDSPKLGKLRNRWIADGKTREQFQAILASVDPTTYATKPASRQVLMFNAEHDEVIPRSCTDSLWQSFGKPDIIWWDAGHYSAIWELPNCLNRMTIFFNEN
jgi:dienelactone hydrolase